MSAFTDYFAAIKKNLAHGDATEHTHRTALKNLLEAVGEGITATNEPKHMPKIGRLDFVVTRKEIPLGHIETKDIGDNLDKTEQSEQLKQYRSECHNLILTDYLEFRWFVGGAPRLTVRIAELDGERKIKPTPDGEEKLVQLLTAFFNQQSLTVGTAKELAERMARMTHIIRDLIIATLQGEVEKGWLHNWHAAFKEVLIPDLDEKELPNLEITPPQYSTEESPNLHLFGLSLIW